MREIADLRDRVKFYQEERDALRVALAEALDGWEWDADDLSLAAKERIAGLRDMLPAVDR